MAALRELVAFCDDLLEPSRFSDYCPNGLQIQGRAEVGLLVSGVTASMALIEAAIEARADALLVHHGYFWKNEPLTLTGIKGARVRQLIRHDISLIAYHLPLDAHPEVGNNALLGQLLGVDEPSPAGAGLLWQGRYQTPLTASALCERIQTQLGREPLLISSGDRRIESIGWCSGAAQSAIEQAWQLGCDAYVSGEISESTVHFAREAGLHYVAAGHHATERHGVGALGARVAERFGIEHRFIDIDNPV